MTEKVMCVGCQKQFPMGVVEPIGVFGLGIVYCEKCRKTSLNSLLPLVKFFLLPASGEWHCETCVWADLDEGDLWCCESGLGRHKTAIASEHCESDEEVMGTAALDIWAKARAAVAPCRLYRNEHEFELKAIPKAQPP